VVNTLTKGQAVVGKLHGNIAATAGSITSTEIAAKGVAMSNIALADTKIPIGSTTGAAVAYALSGDVTMDNVGDVTIGAKKVTPSKMGLANTKISIGSAAGAGAEYALSGDVTMSNTGAVTIVAAAVTSTMVGSLAISSTHLGAGVVLSSKIGAGEVKNANLGAGAVLSSNVGAGEVKSTNIAAAAILSTLVGSLAISSTHLGAGIVLSSKIGTGEVKSANIATGSVLSTKIGNSEVKNANILDKAVYGAKIKAEWSTLSNTTKSVTSVPISAVNKGYFVTNVGSSHGILITGAGGIISNPAVGDWLKFCVATVPSTIPIHVKSTTATFDGTHKFLLLNAVNDSIVLEAISTTRWLAVYNSGVAYSTST